METMIKFCPVCGQGMFIKNDVEDSIFICVDENCNAKIKIKRCENEVILIEYLEKEVAY